MHVRPHMRKKKTRRFRLIYVVRSNKKKKEQLIDQLNFLRGIQVPQM